MNPNRERDDSEKRKATSNNKKADKSKRRTTHRNNNDESFGKLSGLSGQHVAGLTTPNTAASTQCSSASSSIDEQAAIDRPLELTPQQVQLVHQVFQRVAASAISPNANRPTPQQSLTPIAEEETNSELADSSLPLLMGQVRYLGGATAFAVLSFFYYALPLAANLALLLFAAFVVLLTRTLYGLLYNYAMQQWTLMQQNGLAAYVPEVLAPYLDPNRGTSFHQFMTSDSTFARDHMYMLIYALPGLSVEQQDYFVRQFPQSRRQLLHQRGMLLPFLPEEALRLVLGHEGYQRYLAQQSHGDLAQQPLLLPPVISTIAETDSHSELEVTIQDVPRNHSQETLHSSLMEDGPLFIQPWQDPQPSFFSVLRGIGGTAISMVTGGRTRPSEQPAAQTTETPNIDLDWEMHWEGSTTDSDSQVLAEQEYQQDHSVLTNALSYITSSAAISISSSVRSYLSFWTPIVTRTSLLSTTSWIALLYSRYPNTIPRSISFESGTRLISAAFGSPHSSRSRDWSLYTLGLFSVSTIGVAGSMILLQRQLRNAENLARQYNQSIIPKKNCDENDQPN